MVARAHSHGSVEEEAIEMENRAEILKIQEKLLELDSLKSDVAEIKSLLFAQFSQASRVDTAAATTELGEERPVPPGPGMNVAWNLEQNRRSGAQTNFFLEPNTVRSNLSHVISPAIRTTSCVDLGDRSGNFGKRVQQTSASYLTKDTQGGNQGQGGSAVTPWTWQGGQQVNAAQMYYHPMMNTNNSGVNVVCSSGDMNPNYNISGHQYVDAMIRGTKLELPLFSGDEPGGWSEQYEKLFEMVGTPREQWGRHNHPCIPKGWLGDDSTRLEPGSQNYVQLEASDAAGTAGPSMPMRGEGGEQSSGSSDSDEDDDGEVRVDGGAGDDANAIERHVLAPAQRITAETTSEVGALDNGYRRRENSHRSEKRRPKSKVWEEFTPVLSGGMVQSAECKHCKKRLSGKSTGGTSHLRRHLKICPAQPMPSLSSQPDLSVANKLKFGQENSLEELIRAIVFNLCPVFNMVPQATIVEKFLRVFQNEKSKLKEKIKVTPGGVFLSLGGWESDDLTFQPSFLCLTVHFIDEDWKINRRIIRCTYSAIEDYRELSLLREWYSEMNLHERKPAKVLKEAVQDWSLEKKLLGVTLVDQKVTLDFEDNIAGRNYLLAKCKLVTIPCMVGALHELLYDSSWPFVLERRSSWFNYISDPPESRQKYQEVLSQLHLNRPSFGSKKWYSAFYLLEAALQFHKSFPNAKLNSRWRPSIEDLEATENYCKIARLVYHAIKVVSDPHHTTFNSYFHVLWSLRAALQESSNIKNIERVFDVAAMQREFEKNWNKWYLWLSVAVVLDPRYKISFVEFRFKQAFSQDAIMYIREVHAKLYELYIQYSYHVIHVNEQSRGAANHGNNGLQVGDPSHNWSQNYNTQAAVERLKELHEYLGAGVCPHNGAFDILKWWKDNSSTYPTLAMMARDILAIPGCAVSTESAFDECDERATLFNGRLRPETTEALICAQSWIRSSGTMTPN